MSPLRHGDRTLDLVAGQTIFDYADTLKVRVPTSCGRSGECHECIVEVRQGLAALSPPTHAERFLRDNYRLACQAAVVDPDADIEFAVLRRQPRILTESVRRNVEPDPRTFRRGDDVYHEDRRLGPYRDAAGRGAHWRRDMGVLARAGFDFDVARRVMAASSPDDLEEEEG